MKSLFSFEGRIKRSTFWATLVPLFLISFALQIVIALSANQEAVVITIGIIALIYLVPATWICLATYAKRWHDLGMSGWMVLTLLIPLVNLFIFLYLGIAPGKTGANNFGTPPV